VTSVLIPAFDAAKTVEGIVRGALAHCRDVIVVDDGSTDDSGDRAAAAGARVLRHPGNRGKGAALLTGFTDLLSRGADSIVTLDADGQHDPADIPRFIDAWRVTKASIVIGARLEAFAAMSGPRRFGNRFSCAAVRFFRGPSLPDTQCGFRLYDAEFLKSTPFHRRAYDAEVELLMRAGMAGRRIEPLPIRVLADDGRPTSHYRPWLDTYRMCRTVVFYSLIESRLAAARGDRPASP